MIYGVMYAGRSLGTGFFFPLRTALYVWYTLILYTKHIHNNKVIEKYRALAMGEVLNAASGPWWMVAVVPVTCGGCPASMEMCPFN